MNTAVGVSAEVRKARLRTLKVSRWCARVLVAGAFALSAVALWELATDAHIPWWLAWLWPVCIDGSIFQASSATMALAGRTEPEAKDARRWFQWVIAGGVAVSVAANALHAWTTLPGNTLTWWQVTAVAIVPPILLLVGNHGVTVMAGLDASPGEGQDDEPADHTDHTSLEQPPAAEPYREPVPQPEPEEQEREPGPDPVAVTQTAQTQHRAGTGQRDPIRVLTAKKLAEQETPVEVIAERLEVSTRTVRRYLKAEIPDHIDIDAEVIEIEQRPHLVAIETGEVVNG